jgi:hypothetical protein
MATKNSPKPRLGLPVYIALAILIVVAGFFIVEFIAASLEPTDGLPAESAAADSYRERVTALLADADPANGDALLTRYGCVACHRNASVESGIAPAFVGLAARAAERRPPMPADAYIYESITRPGVFIVEDYANSMIQNYARQIPDDDLGDIIAFLLTPDAY